MTSKQLFLQLIPIPGKLGLGGSSFSWRVGEVIKRRLRVLFAAGLETAKYEDFDNIWKAECWSLGYMVAEDGSERGIGGVGSASIGEWPRF